MHTVLLHAFLQKKHKTRNKQEEEEEKEKEEKSHVVIRSSISSYRHPNSKNDITDFSKILRVNF